jgi:23S rRNA pseudouridine1911/1915/1917 synthase
MRRIEASAGRLDAVVASALEWTRADAQRAIEEGRVRVDGQPRPKAHRLRGGERLEVELRDAGELTPAGRPVPVRYEDEHLLIVSKPAGVVTHPTAARRGGTLVNRLLAMGVPLATGGDALRPGIVHRLDVGTSGLLLVAKDEPARLALADQLRRHDIDRRYLALVRGDVENDRFEVDAPLGRRGARVVVRGLGGRRATTAFEVRRRLDGATLLEAAPLTGRTHQIRAHLSAIGHPILGDARYGGGGDPARRLGLERPFLHAWRLSLRHPLTGAPIAVEEPLPDDLARALDRAGGSSGATPARSP